MWKTFQTNGCCLWPQYSRAKTTVSHTLCTVALVWYWCCTLWQRHFVWCGVLNSQPEKSLDFNLFSFQGDNLITECKYTTKDRQNMTWVRMHYSQSTWINEYLFCQLSLLFSSFCFYGAFETELSALTWWIQLILKMWFLPNDLFYVSLQRSPNCYMCSIVPQAEPIWASNLSLCFYDLIIWWFGWLQYGTKMVMFITRLHNPWG